MAKVINVTFLPDLAPPESLQGKTAVVIDVLRATTTIVTALGCGAARVLPCLEVEDARRIAAEMNEPLLGGERGGLRIDGFDLGNSPAEYVESRVSGKAIVFTTTNGTRALQWCRHADSVLIGAFVNLSAVCRRLADTPSIELVCAGTNGQVTREDILVAGAIVARIQKESTVLGDEARIAAAAWAEVEAFLTAGMSLAACLHDSRGGRNLILTQQEADIDLAAVVDRFDCVPELKLEDWSVCLR